jgi:hypothetical protein
MCKKIAELEGVELLTVCEIAGGPVVRYEAIEYGIYNPITDLALNCMLRDKYRVEIDYDSGEIDICRGFAHLARSNYSGEESIPYAVIECILKSQGLWNEQ